ncbi:SpoIID/LytB domain-containing protein [Cyanobacteria bacterium 150NLHA]|nr:MULTISPECIES: SpoIID/LytB domain-containing protein [unclassified Prochlorococcus]KZR65880.1 Amidase enhancer precursor [Prochlorococcus marinus str. MIT 1312]KZR82119.1 Amidase enhancer precursor [Prochlorococcus marinus str. MIT 1327]NMO85092.1 SpoIID/LytB domain-containing protein [Prochlorococcus sp. P1344]NMP06623.1 SpoIID/LytB domain-containing protein [Prochlorococcus sp. P1361]NMP13519.1 SpoIID/LytB domain-containing protein [Prochlorococcus sp.P1363]
MGLVGGVTLTAVSPAAEVIAVQEPVMRVLVLEASALRLRADAEQPLLVAGLGSREQRLRALSVRKQRGQLRLTLEGRSRRSLSLALQRELRVRSADPRGIWLGKRRYRGELRVRSVGAGLQVVNHLRVEDYLASVVGSEMPESWPLAALQAQAVAARTYALAQHGKAGGFDLKATVASQVYRGVESETANTLKAVESTHSLVLVHGGQLIDAVFHSSSGGATEASGAVWSKQLPYLVSVPDHDQHSPVHQWDVWFEPHQLRRAFRETGGLSSIAVLGTTGTGRIRQALVQGPRGDLLLSGKQLRQRLGLKSTLVRFEMLASKSAKPGAGVGLKRFEHSFGDRKSSGAGTVLMGSWRDRTTASVDANASFMGLTPPPPVPPLPLHSTRRSRHQPLMLLAMGQGFGHGVGMSQWGAHGLAQRGADFRQILNHYYRGAEIVPYRQLQNSSLAFLWRSPQPGRVESMGDA